MKKIIFSSIGLLVLMAFTEVSAQVGIGTMTPRGALEISSSTNGFVPSQVALTAINSNVPVVNPQDGLNPIAGTMVYNTATTGTAPNNVTPGYYFWNGTLWVKLAAGNTALDIEEDLRVTIDKGSNPAQLGSLTGVTGPEIWFFRGATGIDAMSFTLQLPHNWKDGTTIYPHIHWTPRTSSTTGNMEWNFDYSWANIDGTFSAVTTSSVIIPSPFTANKHLLSDLTSGNVGIDATNKTYSSVLICRIWRDSGALTDTYDGDAGGLSMDFHISIKNPFVE
jgi:hypothetical protein